jgi:hypothetical protein
MTKFADQLYTDLMREHGSTLADTRPPTASPRQFASHRVLLATGVGALAVAAATGATLAATASGPGSVGYPAAASRTPAYKLTSSHDGTITLAVYTASGIAQANARLHQLGDNVVVVPVEAGCPSIGSLGQPGMPAIGQLHGLEISESADGSVTVNASGVPAGDILVVAVQTTAQGRGATAILTSPPAPSCVSLPAGPGNAVQSGTNVHHTGDGSGMNVAVNTK